MIPSYLDPTKEAEVQWRTAAVTFTSCVGALVGLLFAFVLFFDPYGLRTSSTRAPTPIMSIDQRYVYPQLARSGKFDAAIFGSSTIRLLDPQSLNQSFGARFVNLGLNAGTPWEQMQLAALFLRHVPAPKHLLFGLDRTWCDADAASPEKRLTLRSFPAWLYDDDSLDDYLNLLNLRSLETAARVALHSLGLLPERVRGDGFEVFVPPESGYDLTRAQVHLREGTGEEGSGTAEAVPAASIPDAEGFPAALWLDALLAHVPQATRATLLLPPIHVAAQAKSSSDRLVDNACKAKLAAIAAQHGAALVDFRIPSPITGVDSNYWDKLHYRLPVGQRVVRDLREALASGRDDPNGEYRVLAPGRSAAR